MTNKTTIYERPAELLQNLIRFDTTNPPGNEAPCIAYIDQLCQEAGLETQIIESAPGRANLISILRGRGSSPPLLLYGHVDVVTTAGQEWLYPPFEGRLVDGYIWGRGALDMKAGVAMLLAALLRAKVEQSDLPGDVILALVADEEDGGDFGAKYLVENHADLFHNVHYALGEFGGFTFYIKGKRFYPIMVAEKQVCWMIASVRGKGGHGSMPERGGAMAKMAQLLSILDKKRLPVHITPVARQMVQGMAHNLDGITALVLCNLLNPSLTDWLLDRMGENSRLFDPIFHHTVSPTILHASDKINVIPSRVSVELDGRLLPGYKPEDMLEELRAIAGPFVEFEVVRYDPGPSEPDMTLFDELKNILLQSDPDGIVIPYLLSGVTDARFFSKLGIQTYGFLPMQLPEGFNFGQTIHAPNERIPAQAVEFGTAAIFQALQRF